MRVWVIAAFALGLHGCATTPRDFYADPSKPGTTALCRAYQEATDPTYQRDVVRELLGRGLTAEECESRVVAENVAIIGVAAVATGVVLAAACQDGCPGGGYAPSYSAVDYDCAGGSGDGPYYVQGPFRLNGPDTYYLDADGDGIACEPYGDYGS
jgi:Excalibur calcium-binding domain.